MFAGIDLGGAYTKIATSNGFVDSLYAPLWQNKDALYALLSEVKEKFGGEIEAIGVVMTGELSDCFETRRDGVLEIKNILSAIFDNPAPLFFDRDSGFKDGFVVDKAPLSFASTNWLASATFIAEELYKDAIFVDIGSTTTDVIPIVGGEIKASKTDFERLESGELIYSGILRTNIAALLRKVIVSKQGAECHSCLSVSSELFAITADAYLVLGYIREDEYSCESPNSYAFAGLRVKGDAAAVAVAAGAGAASSEKSRVSALRRLSRVVCSDLEEIDEDFAIKIAEQVKRVQVDELSNSIRRLKEKYGMDRMEMIRIVSAGIGDFIVKEAMESLNLNVNDHFTSLSSIYGKNISAAFPAYSVAKLLEARSKSKRCDISLP